MKIVPVITASKTSATKLPENDEQTTSSGENEALDSSSESDVESEAERKEAAQAERPRKRRRVAESGAEDLEESYFRRLGREEQKEQRQKRAERGGPQDNSSDVEDDVTDAASVSDSDNDSTDEAAPGTIPQHESLQSATSDADRLNRTVFLGNVSTEAIKSKTAKRTLSRHLRSVLTTPPQGKRPGKLESLRFRSTAYVSGSGPKKATFAKKELMDTTTKSTNAYAVFTTDTAADVVTEKLNGSIVLDRHLRVDSLGHPSNVDHRRCIFVGNLSFVDEEVPDEDTKDDPSQPKRPRGRNPADPEEGLWRTFGKVGKVESVRVVRDQETRVSKGFAYVQFTDENSVEAALLLNEKRFPPMLPRTLRVMRAKKMKQRAPSNGVGATRKGRPLLGAGDKRKRPAGRTPGTGANRLVFEGHRASSSSTANGRSGKSKKKVNKRPNTRSSRRGANFKAAGGRSKTK